MAGSTNPSALTLIALRGVPLVQPGDNLPDTIMRALAETGESLRPRDILAIAQKIVSKAEGRVVDLKAVKPSPRAIEYAQAAHKDPRVVELILAESTEVLRHRPGAIIVAHRLGFVMANAGIDASNVGPDGEDRVLLLPADPDRSCREIRERLRERTGVDVAVLIIDSFGRAWRNGTIGTAIGVSGFPALLDLRGTPDLFGRPLQITEVGLADELAAAASLLMGQAAEAAPIVLARGVPYERRESSIQELVRPKAQDLFR
jgi:coenzyme F420-0:L-glutamate ligase/coenzyme F420-1:gamma-L-glutamate ligase